MVGIQGLQTVLNHTIKLWSSKESLIETERKMALNQKSYEDSQEETSQKGRLVEK